MITIAKRGRPDSFDKIIRTVSVDAEDEASLKGLKMLFTNSSLTKRQQQNRYYADLVYFLLLNEISSAIPYLEDIKEHQTIMEQLGRLVFQDGYGGENIIMVVRLAAEWYHEKECTAREIVRWLKGIRRTGIVRTVSYTGDGEEIHNEYKLERMNLFEEESGISETVSEIQKEKE